MVNMRYWIGLCEADLLEGRVFRLDGGYTLPVLVIRNPSEAEARTMIERIRGKRKHASLRGSLIDGRTVLVWDGWDMTHDEVGRELYPDISPYSADLSTFEITDQDGFRYVKPGDYHPLTNRYVKNIMLAMGDASKKFAGPR